MSEPQDGKIQAESVLKPAMSPPGSATPPRSGPKADPPGLLKPTPQATPPAVGVEPSGVTMVGNLPAWDLLPPANMEVVRRIVRR